MAFVVDRDLVVLEPNLFRDVVFDAQVLATADDAVVAGTVLTSIGSDFVAAGVDGGAVAVVDGVSLEVVARLSALSLSLSRVRSDGEGALLPPTAGSDVSVRVSTFGPQVAEAEARVLRSLGVSDAVLSGETVPAALVGSGIRRVVVLAALELVYAAASTRAEGSDPYWARSVWYGERARQELRRVGARLDGDGDGIADSVRRVQPSRLVRE